MKVHNIEWVADGAAHFIQAYANADAPLFLYVGWTLPHGPDADKARWRGAAGGWEEGAQGWE